MEYTQEIREYIGSHIKNTEDGEELRKCCFQEEPAEFFVSRTHKIRGVLCIYGDQAFLISDHERAVRDLLRKLPAGREFTFSFDQKYRQVLSEYLVFDPRLEKENTLRGKKAAGSHGFSCGDIHSKKHPVVEDLKACNSLNGRIKKGLFMVEGALLVKRALSDNQRVETVICTENKNNQEEIEEIVTLCRQKNVQCFKTTPGIMAAVTSTHPVPEILCSVKIEIHGEEDLVISEESNFFLILDGISNPDNLGMILRTADAAGIDGVILLSNSTHFLNKNAVRGARGAVGKLPVYMAEDDRRVFEILKKEQFKIAGTSARFEAGGFYEMDYRYKNIAVVAGNESVGIRKEILDLCTEYVKIPMAEGQSSLNIAVAAALMMYEYVRSNL